ncbi:MAG: hypothetical protein AABZ34_05405 [Nitrospirota bacterium]|mgnify:FL=1
MTQMTQRLATMATMLAFVASVAGPAMTAAAPLEKTPVEIKVRVSEKGFLDDKGRPYGAKRALQVPKDTMVKITFVFAEDMTSLAVGDTHQITIRAEDGWKQETGSVWVMNRESSVSFLAGEKSRTQYRAYCILDCIGMEHLTNLLIQVV